MLAAARCITHAEPQHSLATGRAGVPAKWHRARPRTFNAFVGTPASRRSESSVIGKVVILEFVRYSCRNRKGLAAYLDTKYAIGQGTASWDRPLVEGCPVSRALDV